MYFLFLLHFYLPNLKENDLTEVQFVFPASQNRRNRGKVRKVEKITRPFDNINDHWIPSGKEPETYTGFRYSSKYLNSPDSTGFSHSQNLMFT